MGLNDFLIHSNALNIQLPCNLITQSREGLFREYLNKWQITWSKRIGSKDFAVIL